MHIARYKKKQAAPLDTSNKNNTQQKRHPLMSFENNGTLQQGHMTNTPPKIEKYNDTHKNGALQKWHTCKKMPKGYLPGHLSDF